MLTNFFFINHSRKYCNLASGFQQVVQIYKQRKITKKHMKARKKERNGSPFYILMIAFREKKYE